MQGIPDFPTAPGKVIFADFRSSYGCLVIIQRDSCPKETNGTYARQGKCQTRYAHMATRTIKKKGRNVKVCDIPTAGDIVNTCDRIGRMSGTGKTASPDDYPSHLHFEMRSQSESTVFKPLLTVAGITNSPNYNRAGSVACNSVKKSVGFFAIDLNKGRIKPTIRQAEGVE